MAGFTDQEGGSEFSGGTFVATFPDSNTWGETTWKNVTCDLVGSSTWSVTSFKVARFDLRVTTDGTGRPFRYIVVGTIPAGVTGTWKVRVTNGAGVTMNTVNDAVDRTSLSGTASYDSGTSRYTHTPNGSGLFQLLGVWTDGTSIPKLGWKAIPNGTATTAEGDAYFRPSAVTGKPAYAFCVQVADINSTDTAKNCVYVRLASSIVT
jgi:hypothetical protein